MSTLVVDHDVQGCDHVRMETRGLLRSEGEGTEVSVRSRAVIDLPVPQRTIQSRQRRSVGSMLGRLVDLVR